MTCRQKSIAMAIQMIFFICIIVYMYDLKCYLVILTTIRQSTGSPSTAAGVHLGIWLITLVACSASPFMFVLSNTTLGATIVPFLSTVNMTATHVSSLYLQFLSPNCSR